MANVLWCAKGAYNRKSFPNNSDMVHDGDDWRGRLDPIDFFFKISRWGQPEWITGIRFDSIYISWTGNSIDKYLIALGGPDIHVKLNGFMLHDITIRHVDLITWLCCGAHATSQANFFGKMIILLSLNITMKEVGGASVIAIFTTRR